MKKITVSFRNSRNAPNISSSLTVAVSHFRVSAIQTVRSPVTNMAARLNPECILDKFNKTKQQSHVKVKTKKT